MSFFGLLNRLGYLCERMKTVAFIPIRLNSKRIPAKNLKFLGGKPLMYYILDVLTKVNSIDDIYVYCSDERIIQHLPSGIKFLKRPQYLDKDETLGEQIYDEFIKTINADIYILAHTTSPFIKAATIENSLAHIINGDNDSAFSCKKIQTFCWYNNNPLNYNLKNIPRTQDIEPVYEETSAFYMFRRNIWSGLHQRIGRNPYFAITDDIESVDIDWPEDFSFAERIINNIHRAKSSCTY